MGGFLAGRLATETPRDDFFEVFGAFATLETVLLEDGNRFLLVLLEDSMVGGGMKAEQTGGNSLGGPSVSPDTISGGIIIY